MVIYSYPQFLCYSTTTIYIIYILFFIYARKNVLFICFLWYIYVREMIKVDSDRIHNVVIVILNMAKESMETPQYFLFSTTLEQYEVQLNLMASMKEAWEKDGLMVKKSYGGKIADATHPLIQDYNKTARAASTTANSLLKILDKAKLNTEQYTGLKTLVDKMNNNE